MNFNANGIIHSSTSSFLDALEDFETVDKVEYKDKKRIHVKYINVPMSFDIETSSFYIGDEKFNTMYIWQFGINGHVCYGRTWEQFTTFMKELKIRLGLGFKKRAVIYVHNLAYEFQYIKDMLIWESVFAREARHPIYARSDSGFEFRCSYTLSGSSLEQTAKDCLKYKCSKKVGQLDYDLVRTSKTFLTQSEIEYCVYDVICVMDYIKEEMERYNNDITKIPMTKTGKVRLRCKDRLLSPENRKKYRALMKRLTLEYKEYKMLRNTFQGGFTHANWCEVGLVHERVASKDFTSSYPTVMISEKYPMSKGVPFTLESIEELHKMSKHYCMIFNVHFEEVTPKFMYEHYLSASKCFRITEDNKKIYLNEKSKDCKVDNGRVIEAKNFYTTITDVDFTIMERAYNLKGVKFFPGYRYAKDYLPTEFVKIIIELYDNKTTLKDVEDKVIEYMLSKADLNSTYGMTVTDIINDTIEFSEGEWSTKITDEEKAEDLIAKYNEGQKRFLFYPWGVFVTAYARRNLWSGILALGDDYIYSDTDSVKYKNEEQHTQYFDYYNNWITNRLRTACEYHGINPDRTSPLTIKGKRKPLGVWDDEAEDTPEGKLYARRFKTLGAKRYMKEYWNEKKQRWEIKITIAGVSKTKGSDFLNLSYPEKLKIQDEYKKKNIHINVTEDPFEMFEDDMTIPDEYSGRLISTYIDTSEDCWVTDYQGNPTYIKGHSGIHMEKSSYNLTMTDIYKELLHSRDYVMMG